MTQAESPSDKNTLLWFKSRTSPFRGGVLAVGHYAFVDSQQVGNYYFIVFFQVFVLSYWLLILIATPVLIRIHTI